MKHREPSHPIFILHIGGYYLHTNTADREATAQRSARTLKPGPYGSFVREVRPPAGSHANLPLLEHRGPQGQLRVRLQASLQLLQHKLRPEVRSNQSSGHRVPSRGRADVGVQIIRSEGHMAKSEFTLENRGRGQRSAQRSGKSSGQTLWSACR